jgi:transmembrane sensor
MENRLTYYTDLIIKHLAGETSAEEVLDLSGWINSDPKNRAHFEELVKTWGIIQKSDIEKNINIDKEWGAFQAKINDGESMENHKASKPGARVSAPSSTFRPLFYDNFFHTSYRRTIRLAALFLLLAIPAFLLFRYFSKPEMKEVFAEGRITENNLPDGSAVTLNRGSTLEYPEKFKGKSRNVVLNGEAFFQVSHDKQKPFTISSGNVMVEVLGTTFYVNTHAGENRIDVVLTTGSVAVYYKNDPQRKVILEPGEKAEVSIQGKEITKSQNEDPNYLAWKTGTLIFNGDPLSKIVPVLNKVYHSDIRLTGPGAGDCLFSATFHEQSLESVLNVLKATLDLQIKRTGATIEISGNGCK